MKKRYLKILALMIFAVVSLAAACSGAKNGGGNVEVAVEALPVASPTVAQADGAEIYRVNCAVCHGVNGEGDKRGIPLTSGHALNHTEAQYNAQIRFGKGTKMPAFKDKLTAEEIAATVNYVMNVIQAGLPRGTKH